MSVPLWELSAVSTILAVTITAAAALHARPAFISWTVCCVLIAIVVGALHTATPSNSSLAGDAVFVVAPMLATFEIERVWFKLGRAVSRPLITIVLSFPLGMLTFASSLFVALIIAVNVGLLEP